MDLCCSLWTIHMRVIWLVGNFLSECSQVAIAWVEWMGLMVFIDLVKRSFYCLVNDENRIRFYIILEYGKIFLHLLFQNLI